MKFFILILSVWGCVQTASAQGRAADTTEAIASQLDVTRAAVDQMVRYLGDRRNQTKFNVKDYKSLSPVFQAEVERVLLVFEAQLKTSIMPRVQILMDRYNQVNNSSEFSDDQKKVILEQQWQLMQVEIKNIEKDYKAEILKVYKGVGNLPYRSKFSSIIYYDKSETKNEPHLKKANLETEKKLNKMGLQIARYAGWRAYLYPDIVKLDETPVFSVLDKSILICTTRLRAGEYADGTRAEITHRYDFTRNWTREAGDYSECTESSEERLKQYQETMLRVYRTNVYAQIANGCRSQLCVALTAADRSYFINLVMKNIDQAIVLEVGAGKTARKIILGNLNFNSQTILDFLSFVDVPANLPFDTE